MMMIRNNREGECTKDRKMERNTRRYKERERAKTQTKQLWHTRNKKGEIGGKMEGKDGYESKERGKIKKRRKWTGKERKRKQRDDKKNRKENRKKHGFIEERKNEKEYNEKERKIKE